MHSSSSSSFELSVTPPIWALLPVKRFADAKQRIKDSTALNQSLNSGELAKAMFLDVIDALMLCERLDGIAVVTNEPELGSLLPESITIIEEPAGGGLNLALQAGVAYLYEQGIQHCVLLPADIPLVAPSDIDTTIANYQQCCANNNADEVIAINGCHDGCGTNLLCMSTKAPLTLAYGIGSYQQHRSLAQQANKTILTIESPNIALDVDTGKDIKQLQLLADAGKLTSATRTLALMQRVKLHDANLSAEIDAISTNLEGLSRTELYRQAAELRDEGFGNNISYSRKVFIPLTRLCRDVCHYCTFATVPKQVESPFLSPEQVLEIAHQGKAMGCKEALFTLGEKPELRYSAARQALQEMGFATTLEYVAHVAKRVLDETGLLPHINAGCMTAQEIQMLRPVSASMGIMLENVSPRLCEKGQPHYGSPDKQPAARIATLVAAGEAAVPMTTGILIGIGETNRERIESLLAIRDLHQRFGNIQEVIIQNFVPKQDTKMSEVEAAPIDELLWTIAVARLIFGPNMSLQVPPNLNKGNLQAVVDAGINDWGGVSPVTPDHVNPESPWPHLDKLTNETALAGKHLIERLTLYPSYFLQRQDWLDNKVAPHLLKLVDTEGFAREDDWLSGVSEDIPTWPTHPDVISMDRAQPSSKVQKILEKSVQHPGTLSPSEIVTLFKARGRDFSAVCQTADQLRRQVKGDTVTYVINRNINYTNICTYRCTFCAFSKGSKINGPGDAPYLKSDNEIAALASEAVVADATEVCLQGGIHPKFTGQTYLDICQAVREAEPDLHIHAFSPLEVWHGAQTLNLSVYEFILRLKEVGLKSLPGTAAEILHDDIRDQICSDKINTAQWLEVMAAAHKAGLKTTATIMFGHLENYEHWAAHLLRIRELQDKTGGFTEFVPLSFVAHEAPMYKRGQARRGPTLRESVLMHAVSRLVFHGAIDNIQTSWVKMGIEGAKLCLKAGANDFGGVLMNESITRAAGATHGQLMPKSALLEAIRSCGRQPQQRSTFYQPIETLLTSDEQSIDVLNISDSYQSAIG